MPAKVKLTAKDKEAIELDRQRDEDDRAQTEERAAFLRLFEKTTQAELLEESLKSRKVFHAYLFHGPKGSLKEEAAILFGVSILAGSHGLFNEVTASEAELEAAMQAYRGDHSDVIFLNGNRKEQIKKEASRCLECGRSVVDPNKCIGCGMCTVQCKFDAIHLTRAMGDRYSRMIPAEQKFAGIGKHIPKRVAGIIGSRLRRK